MYFARIVARQCLHLVVGCFLASCTGSVAGEVDDVKTPAKSAVQARLVAPTTLRKAQLPEDVTRVLRESIHAELDCSSCHPAQSDEVPGANARKDDFSEARCDHCHKEQSALYESSVHASIEPAQSTRAAVCAQCHGDHDIYEQNDPRSRVSKRNLSAMCAACHESPEVKPRLRAAAADVGAHYRESIHGRALLLKGFTVAPSCTDCHGAAHRLKAPGNTASDVSEQHIADACGKCHEGALEEYRKSIHFAARSRGNLEAPTCPTCHTAHDISATGTKSFRLSSDTVCGKCHEARRNQYLDTYHGRAHFLGDARVAACYDCHGAHAINRASDPRSTISSENRVSTCRKCHTSATKSFAAFIPHADHKDAKKYPELFWTFWAMTSLLLGTFAFFGIHTAFWFTRSLRHFFSNRAEFLEQRRQAKDVKNARLFLRFRPVDRFCHVLLVISFLTLVATGMPLKFHTAPWAQSVFSFLGGVETAGRIHRVGALLTLTYFVIHLSSLVGPIRRRRAEFRDAQGRFRLSAFLRFAFGPDSPLPNLQDARDLVAHGKWFVGKGPRPTFDRFTYWEKFDYMAVFWGVTMIGISGLVMWFPVAATRVLPGWAINVAHIIHSDEALLAAGFIFTFHFFNGHFRPEKFPLDPVIFSGHITESEMMHERRRQYERLKAENKLESMVTTVGQWPSWKWVLTPFGAVALIIGLTLAVAIFWAMAHELH